MLKGKHIIVGISGGIAAYKIATLVRLLIKKKAEVQVIMTPSAKEFITPLTLSTLSGKPVISEFFTANTGQWNSHVDLGLWADAMLIAPATASTIGKMANGIADNMLITTYLSAKSQVFVAPSMDLDMMAHPSTCGNLEKLKSYGNIIIEPAEGELASHLVGKGRMEEPEAIVSVLEDYFTPKDFVGKRMLITAGPTFERIDPVRFIGNYSSGKMGYSIAEEAASRGAEVTIVSGPVDIKVENKRINVISVESARQMNEECLKLFPGTDCAVMCAAVADYAPEKIYESKIKREEGDAPVIRLVKNPDIAANLGNLKQPGQMLVGFALETDNEQANAERKLERKHLDMIVLNSLRDKGAGFGTDTNKITVFTANGVSKSFPLKSKREVAKDLLDMIVGYSTDGYLV